jgi:hypothetical protein
LILLIFIKYSPLKRRFYAGLGDVGALVFIGTDTGAMAIDKVQKLLYFRWEDGLKSAMYPKYRGVVLGVA